MPKLYKYRSLTSEKQRESVRRLLLENEIYFPPPVAFNDPFEFRCMVTADVANQITLGWAEEIARRNHPNLPPTKRRELARRIHKIIGPHIKRNAETDFLMRLYQEVRPAVGVLALTEVRDNILMWSHYSDGHRGICIEFEVSDQTLVLGKAERVTYSGDLPKFTIELPSLGDAWRTAALTKSLHWEYEHEWRVVDTLHGAGSRQIPTEAITGVIVGHAIPLEHLRLVCAWLVMRGKPVPLYQAGLTGDEYSLTIVRLSDEVVQRFGCAV